MTQSGQYKEQIYIYIYIYFFFLINLKFITFNGDLVFTAERMFILVMKIESILIITATFVLK